ncbi:MAG: c-type cytochrome [Erythrobacter sp.]
MTRAQPLALALTFAFALAACGSDPEPPTEQITVSEPGAAQTAPAAATAPEVAATDPVAAGKAAFAVCTACHSAEPGAAAGIGPNLAGVVGRKAGTLEGFAYSEAMKASAITWNEAELDTYLTLPAARVPGTKMTFAGVSDPAKRAAIIAYLASITG